MEHTGKSENLPQWRTHGSKYTEKVLTFGFLSLADVGDKCPSHSHFSVEPVGLQATFTKKSTSNDIEINHLLCETSPLKLVGFLTR